MGAEGIGEGTVPPDRSGDRQTFQGDAGEMDRVVFRLFPSRGESLIWGVG